MDISYSTKGSRLSTWKTWYGKPCFIMTFHVHNLRQQSLEMEGFIYVAIERPQTHLHLTREITARGIREG